MKTVPQLTGRTLPILFSGPMVRAILADKKTETRRIVKGTKLFHERAALLSFKDGVATFGDSIPDDPVPITVKARCSAGDTLWVRETFAILTGNGHRTVYRADGDEPRRRRATTQAEPLGPMRWTPSIFMRPSQSRIRLKVERVRVERLQCITPEAIRSEGVDETSVAGLLKKPLVADTPLRDLWRLGWDAINGKTMPWKLDPYVWVIEFARLP